uniref:Uncharacterized protein n=1 Tax=viral metagenome TaxID=1070528 RepID=A0A6C0KID7_9ZZZZ
MAITSAGKTTGNMYTSDETDWIRKLMLSKTMTKITTHYTNYINGHFSDVTTPFNLENEFSNLSSGLLEWRKNSKNYSTYEMVRASIITSLELLQQSLNQYMDMITATGKLSAAQTKADILDDATALEEYIQKLNDTSELNVFPEVTVSAPLFSMKPEYVYYIQRHGFPIGGVFDSVYLASILHDIEQGILQ